MTPAPRFKSYSEPDTQEDSPRTWIVAKTIQGILHHRQQRRALSTRNVTSNFPITITAEAEPSHPGQAWQVVAPMLPIECITTDSAPTKEEQERSCMEWMPRISQVSCMKLETHPRMAGFSHKCIHAVEILIPSDRIVREWTTQVTITHPGSRPAQMIPSVEFDSSTPHPETFTMQVCQHDLTHTAYVTQKHTVLLPRVENFVLSKTDAKSVCGVFPARVSRCMNQYTSMYEKQTTKTFRQTAIRTLASPFYENDEPGIHTETFTRSVASVFVTTIQGPHWGIANPESIRNMTVEKDCQGVEHCIELSCHDKETCLKYCESRREAEVKVLTIISFIFLILSFISVSGALMRSLCSRGREGNVTPKNTLGGPSVISPAVDSEPA